MADRVGQVLGPYSLVRLLGRSAFAEVYLAEGSLSMRPVAVKVLTVPHTPQEMERVRMAVQTMIRLSHPALLPIRESGVVESHPYLVMDYAPSGSLRTLIPRGTTVELSALLSVLNQVIPALQFAHEHSLIHGNLKPENLLLGPKQQLLLSDFCFVVAAASRRLTSWHEAIPPPVYLAPEQLYGQEQFASDQYALGMMVYEWLSGDVAFHGTFEELLQQQGSQAPLPLRAVVPTISPSVEQVVQRALAKDPSSRFASIQAFAQELEQACQAAQSALSEFLPSGADPSFSLLPTEPLSPPVRTLLAPGTLICHYWGHTHAVTAAAWSLDGVSLASASRDKTVQVWDAITGDLHFTYLGHTDRVNAVTWSPSGSRIASASHDGTMQVWNVEGGRPRFIARSRAPHVEVAAWSPDGKRIASTGSQHVEIWNAFTGELLLTLLSHAYGINTLSWSPYGTTIATGGNDHLVHIWNATRGDRLLSYPGHADAVLAVAWSPDGTKIASAGRDHTVQVWEAASGTTRGVYRGEESGQEVCVVAWSPTSRHLACGASDGTVRVWDTTTGDMLFSYCDHAGTVINRINAVAWSPDGTRIASASDDGTVRIWWAPLHGGQGFTGGALAGL